jgi:hypothetical protein
MAEYEQALDYYRQGLRVLKLTGDIRFTALCLVSIAWVQTRIGDMVVAIRLLGAAETLRQSIATVLEPADLLAHEKLVNLLKEYVTQLEFEAAWLEGSQFSLERVLAIAQEDDLPIKSRR